MVRAARWDGVTLAAMTDEGGVELPGAGKLAAAAAESDRPRGGLNLFNAALATQRMPHRND